MNTSQELLKSVIAEQIESPNAEYLSKLPEIAQPADVAWRLDNLSTADILPLLTLLPEEYRADVIAELSWRSQTRLLKAMPQDLLLNLFECSPSDVKADLFNLLTKQRRAALLEQIPAEERAELLKMASYEEGTVGSETTTDFVALKATDTARDALKQVRLDGDDQESIYVTFVLDDKDRLLGTVSLRQLVLADPDIQVSELMRGNPVWVRAEWPEEKASEVIRRNDFLAVPVINGGDRMIGIVTVDDAMDIEKEQDAGALASFGGSPVVGGGPDLDLIQSSFKRLFCTRFFWLAVLTFFGVFTSTFVAHQEEVIESVVILAAFIAPIIDMGGNTGSQAATMVIRAMALGDVRVSWKDTWFIIRRELPIVACLGISIATLEGVLAYFSKGSIMGDNTYGVLMTVGLSMLVCTCLGGIIGSLLPFAARLIKTDPATLSSPLITSLMDLIGVLVYFGFAYMFLADAIAGGGA